MTVQIIVGIIVMALFTVGPTLRRIPTLKSPMMRRVVLPSIIINMALWFGIGFGAAHLVLLVLA